GARLAERFLAEHRARYGFVADGALEVVQVIARAETPCRALPPTARAGARPEPRRRRAPIGRGTIPVFARSELGAATRIEGPAIIEEATATTLVPAGHAATETRLGLVLAARHHRA